MSDQDQTPKEAPSIQAAQTRQKLDYAINAFARDRISEKLYGVISLPVHEILGEAKFAAEWPSSYAYATDGRVVWWDYAWLQKADVKHICWMLLKQTCVLLNKIPFILKREIAIEPDFVNLCVHYYAVTWMEEIGVVHSSEAGKPHPLFQPPSAHLYKVPSWGSNRDLFEMLMGNLAQFRADREAKAKELDELLKFLSGLKPSSLSDEQTSQISAQLSVMQIQHKNWLLENGKDVHGDGSNRDSIEWQMGVSRVSWKTKIANVVTRNLRTVPTGQRRNRFNRRLTGVGVLAHPLKFSGTKEMLFMLDVSGSNLGNIGTGVAHILKIAQNFNISHINAIYIETEVVGQERVPFAQAVANPTGAFNIKGAGGTDMTAGFTWKANSSDELAKIDYDLVCCVTDGETPWPTKEQCIEAFGPKVQIAWVLINRSQWVIKHYKNPEYGIVIDAEI